MYDIVCSYVVYDIVAWHTTSHLTYDIVGGKNPDVKALLVSAESLLIFRLGNETPCVISCMISSANRVTIMSRLYAIIAVQ